MNKYVLTFELYSATYLAAANKLQDKGHFDRAETLLKNAGFDTKNKYDIFMIEPSGKNGFGLNNISIFFGDNRKLTIMSNDGIRYSVAGDKFTSRKDSLQFIRSLKANQDFLETLEAFEMEDIWDYIGINDFYHQK
jgi:hypothetical protein